MAPSGPDSNQEERMKRTKKTAGDTGRGQTLEYLGIRITPETRRRLQELADADGRSVSGMIRVALESYLQKQG